MAIAAVMAADLYNGLNTHVWTGWIFFAVALGIVLVWAYTVSYCRPLGSSRRLTGSPGYLFDNLSWMVLYTYLW